jgi:hypothetical protein
MTPRHRGCPSRPLDRGVEVRNIDDEGAAELLFRVGERALLHDKLTADKRDGSSRVRLLEHLGAGEHARVLKRLCIRLERTHPLDERLGPELLGSGLWIVEQKGVSHDGCPF